MLCHPLLPPVVLPVLLLLLAPAAAYPASASAAAAAATTAHANATAPSQSHCLSLQLVVVLLLLLAEGLPLDATGDLGGLLLLVCLLFRLRLPLPGRLPLAFAAFAALPDFASRA